jgi:hypothetical protein
MEEARLNHLLRGLPREAASPGFTAQVLRRLDSLYSMPRPAGNRPHRLPPRQRWHRWHRWHRFSVATATVGALGVSVGISVGVLQRERPSLQPTTLASAAAGMAATAGGSAALSIERTFRHEAAAPGELTALGLGPRQAANRPGDGTAATTAATSARQIDSAQAHQLLHQLQLERASLERELRRLRRPGGGSPTVLYLGGDDTVDLVLSTGRTRVPGPPPGDRDDGENFNYL